MKLKDKEPKFKIGQSVYLKDEVDYYRILHNQKYDTYGNPKPRNLTIIGIAMEECEGGIQIFYRFIQFANGIPEIALVSEFPNLNNEVQ